MFDRTPCKNNSSVPGGPSGSLQLALGGAAARRFQASNLYFTPTARHWEFISSVEAPIVWWFWRVAWTNAAEPLLEVLGLLTAASGSGSVPNLDFRPSLVGDPSNNEII